MSALRERYIVSCFNCRSLFDGAAANWCDCRREQQTLVCPRCLRCYCMVGLDAETLEQAPKPPRQEPLSFADIIQPVRPVMLIVEDDPRVQSAAAAAVRAFGQGVMVTPPGSDRFAAAEESHPAFLIAGRLLAEAARRSSRTSVVVMTTGVTEEAESSSSVPPSLPSHVAELQRVLEGLLSDADDIPENN